MPCIKIVVIVNCQYCQGVTIKFGKTGVSQRYRCKSCNKIQLNKYKSKVYKACISFEIAAQVNEGRGVRSVARLLNISAGTVLSRIKTIADAIKKTAISIGQDYEVDELKTYMKKKTNDYWVIYAIDHESRQVIDYKVGKRTKKNIKRVTDTLLLADCEQIYTDGLDTYKFVIPDNLHSVKRYGTNRIERKNLSLRTHLKRLNRKTIAYSKSLLMLDACLKIYFWHDEQNS